jgi:hypothetical protein
VAYFFQAILVKFGEVFKKYFFKRGFPPPFFSGLKPLKQFKNAKLEQ